jgi:plasmid stabilization system protein ParE
VAAFRFSRRAEADLLSIGDYTLRTWGKAQAARYLGELEVCCQTLSDNPQLLQLGVFKCGLFEDGDVRVGIFPQNEELQIRRLGFSAVALQ